MKTVLIKIVFYLACLSILAACEPMTPEEQAAYNRQIEAQNRIRTQQCLNDNRCPETAAKVRAICEPIIERRFNYERQDIYGNMFGSRIVQMNMNGYFDTSISSGVGNNGYILYGVVVMSGGGGARVSTDFWYVKCVTVGDTPKLLTVDYKLD